MFIEYEKLQFLVNKVFANTSRKRTGMGWRGILRAVRVCFQIRLLEELDGERLSANRHLVLLRD